MALYNMQYELQEAPFEPTGKMFHIAGVGWMQGWGRTADFPADGQAEWAPGARWTDIETGKLYVNQGTSAACNFDEVTGIA